MKLAASMARLGTESAFEVLAKARALEAKGKNIVHLEIGQPDFPTPQHVREAGKKAIDDGWTGYGPTAGFPDFLFGFDPVRVQRGEDSRKVVRAHQVRVVLTDFRHHNAKILFPVQI